MAREPRKGEVDGKDCRFVSSVEQMERDNLYGTSIKAVQEVANDSEVRGCLSICLSETLFDH